MRVRNRNETVISHCGAEEGSLQRRPKLKTSKFTFFLGGKKNGFGIGVRQMWSYGQWGGQLGRGRPGVTVWAVQLALLKKKNYFCCPLQLQCITSCRCSFSISISVSLVKDRIPLQ